MNIQSKKFYWISTPSPWDQAQTWRAKRQAAAEQFQSQNDSFLAGVADAQYAEIDGGATIAVKVAISRIQAQGKAKIAANIKRGVNRTA